VRPVHRHGERDQVLYFYDALVGVAWDGDAFWDGGDLGSHLGRRLVVDLAAGMESCHDSTTRLKTGFLSIIVRLGVENAMQPL